MAQERREQITVPIDPQLRARLQEAAEADGRTVAGLVRHIVVQALGKQGEGAPHDHAIYVDDHDVIG